jgi:hypothetical protein
MQNVDPIMDLLLEFLEAGIQYLLYIRQVYPSNLFSKTMLYHIPVYKATHPKLKEYLDQLMTAIQDHFHQFQKLFLVIQHGERVVEKYTFEILKMQDTIKDVDPREIQDYLRAFFIKLSCLDSTLAPLPTSCQWNCFFEVKGDIPLADSMYTVNEQEIQSHGSLIPIKTVRTNQFKIQLVVET